MSRNELITWLNNAEQTLRNVIGDPMSTVYNWYLGQYNYLLSIRQWIYNNWVAFWRSSPSFLAPVTNWLSVTIWTYGINPTFDRVLSVLHVPIDVGNYLWDYSHNWWAPATTIAYYTRRAADVVIGAYDGLMGGINGVYTSLSNYIGSIESWASEWIHYLDSQRAWADWWVNEIVNVHLPNMSIGLGVLNNIVYSWQPTLNQFFTDPGEFVWNYLLGSIAEKIRVLLKSMW